MSTEVPFIDIGEDGDPVPENGVAAERPARDPKPEPKHRRNAPKGDDRRPMVRAEDPPRSFAEGHDPRHPKRELREQDTWSLHWLSLWTSICEWLPRQKIGREDDPEARTATPEDIIIYPVRVSGAGQVGGAEYDPIDGVEVAGSDDENPAVALNRVMISRYHIPACVDGRSRATWKLTFAWRLGGRGAIKTSNLFTLPSPDEIRRQKKAAGEVVADVSEEQHPGGKDYLHGRLEAELEAARRENRAPKSIEQIMSGAPVQPGDWRERLELEKQLAEAKAKADAEKTAREAAEKHAAEKADLQRQLDAMKAQQEKDALNARLADLERRIANPPQAAQSDEQRMLLFLQAIGLVQVGPDGKPVPVGSIPAQPLPPPAAQSAEELAARIISHQKSADEAKSKLRAALGLRDENEAEAIVEKEEEEKPTLVGKLLKTVTDNVDVILAGGAVAVGAVADNILQPGAAAVVKGAVEAAQKQAAMKGAGRVIPGGGGGGRPPSA